MAQQDIRVCPNCNHRGLDKICPRDGFPTVLENLIAADGDAPDLLGRVFGERYRVDALIGKGGMGWVFRALHVVMQQTVALKIMKRELARDVTAIKRFYHEARACSRLRHHHTIKVHDFGVSDDGYPYIAMEFLEGRPLSRVLAKQKRLAAGRAVRIAQQICKSLQEAHEAGIVHRDLKPANIFLTDMPGERDYVKVLDFGIAKFRERGDVKEKEALTKTGVVIGTPRYMSPEQIRGRDVDRRSDLYSLGVMLFEMLTGRVPFSGDSTAEMLAQQLNDPAPPLELYVSTKEVPEGLCRLVERLLAKEAAERPASAQQLAELLLQFQDSESRLSEAEPALPTPAVGGGFGEDAAPDTAEQPMPPAAMQGADEAEPPRAAAVAISKASSVGSRSALDSRYLDSRLSRRRLLWIVAALSALVAAAITALIVFRDVDRLDDSGSTADPNWANSLTASLRASDVAGPAVQVAPAAPDAMAKSLMPATLPAASADAVGGAPVPADAIATASQPDFQAKVDATPTDTAAQASQGPDARLPSAADVSVAISPVRPAMVTVVVDSQPSEAKVLRDGRSIGETPYVLNAAVGSKMRLVVRKPGFHDEKLTVMFDQEKVETVRLRVKKSGFRPEIIQ